MTLVNAGRLCRPGQTRPVKAYLIGNKAFPGDSIPINIKQSRGEAEEALRKRLSAGEFGVMDFTGTGASPTH